MSNSTCETLRIGFVSLIDPYLQLNALGKVKGLSAELFDDIKEFIPCKFIEWIRFVEQRPDDGLSLYGGRIEDGTLFSSGDSTIIRPQDPLIYAYSHPIAFDSMAMIEKERDIAGPMTTISSLVVFDPVEWLIIIGLLIASNMIEFLVENSSLRRGEDGEAERRRCGTPAALEAINSVGEILRALGFLLLILIHASCFTGNSVTGLPAQTTFEQLSKGLLEGSRQFIFSSDAITFSDEEGVNMTGYNAMHEAPSTFDALRKVCSDSAFVAPVWRSDLDKFRLTKEGKKCRLAEIPVRHTDHTGSKDLDRAILVGVTQHFLFPKTTPRKVRQFINKLILVIYDKRMGFLQLAQPAYMPPPLATYAPLQIEQLVLTAVATIAGLIVSIIFVLGELVTARIIAFFIIRAMRLSRNRFIV